MGVARVNMVRRRGRISLSQERTGGSQPTCQGAQHSKRGENLQQLHFRGFHLRTATMVILSFTAPAREHPRSLPELAGVGGRLNGTLYPIYCPANRPPAWGHGGRMEGVWRYSDVGRTTSWFC